MSKFLSKVNGITVFSYNNRSLSNGEISSRNRVGFGQCPTLRGNITNLVK
jgi:hypothetical protein